MTTWRCQGGSAYLRIYPMVHDSRESFASLALARRKRHNLATADFERFNREFYQSFTHINATDASYFQALTPFGGPTLLGYVWTLFVRLWQRLPRAR